MTEAQAREFVVKMKAAAVPVAVRADSRKGVFPPKGSVAGKTAPQKPKPTAAAPSPASPAWGSNSNSSTQVQQQQQQPPASSLPPSSATSAPVIAEEKTSAMTTISVADAIALLHSPGGVEIGEYMRRHPRRKGAQKRDFGPIGGERFSSNHHNNSNARRPPAPGRRRRSPAAEPASGTAVSPAASRTRPQADLNKTPFYIFFKS